MLSLLLTASLTVAGAFAASETTIFYVTDREFNAHDQTGCNFGCRAGKLVIWNERIFSGMERSHDQYRCRDAMLTDDQRRERFITDLKRTLDQAPQHDVLIFIHGYNNTFEDAMNSGRALADGMGFRGVVVLYSWASAGDPLKYYPDRHRSKRTSTFLADALERIRDTAGPEHTYIVAHSMGNRALMKALEKCTDDRLAAEVVFVAPDVNSLKFRATIPRVRHQAGNLVLYANKNDRVLHYSHRLPTHWLAWSRRGKSIKPVQGVQVRDVSNLAKSQDRCVAHSYFRCATVAEDMAEILSKTVKPRHLTNVEVEVNGVVTINPKTGVKECTCDLDEHRRKRCG